ncbi:hypothetical protein H0H81_002538 [Sphagnurus paluster]|uniref:Glucose-methanol-choline oxidoreductase N-terminal domain-containing protein n=1 Tax=Sphagnurus paluster TaxID=117069 RepID=A0A9P7FTA3_9AGAR|nr:hypothetical protein H0H81_002538 [Sphagnurus paluster]
MSVYDWKYNTTAQTIGGKVLSMTQGKVLGGSSSINGMCWKRGTVDQYDSLGRLGNSGWNFESLFHYMKKAEKYHLPNLKQTSLGATAIPDAHGYYGKVNAGFPQPYEGAVVTDHLIMAARATIPNLAINLDVASGNPNGAARFQFSIKPGNSTVVRPNGNVRSSSANAYIYPSLPEQPNFIILVGHQATSLVWRKLSGSLSFASGVKFIATPLQDAKPGREFDVKIENEAIVASGAIGSPHFLELSGVGDSRILKKVGIPVEASRVDLPAVGTNLQDQALNIATYAIAPNASASDYTILNAPLTPAVAFADIEQILGTNAAHIIAKDLVESIPARAKAIVSSGAFTSESGMTKILAIQAESIITHKVDPRFFISHDLDLYLKGNASRLARKVFDTPALRQYVNAELAPGLTVVPKDASDAQCQNFVIAGYGPVLHPVGSVPMLPRKDGGAVGPDLIVYGTSNVRVIGKSFIVYLEKT